MSCECDVDAPQIIGAEKLSGCKGKFFVSCQMNGQVVVKLI